jgi:hypothetical protein
LLAENVAEIARACVKHVELQSIAVHVRGLEALPAEEHVIIAGFAAEDASRGAAKPRLMLRRSEKLIELTAWAPHRAWGGRGAH